MATNDHPPLGLPEALRLSAQTWQNDLLELFHNAKDRFADVVWEFQSDDQSSIEDVWGHKAIVSARAPPSFQARYLFSRPVPNTSPTPHSTPLPSTENSSVSLSLTLDYSRSPSPYRSPSPSITQGGIFRISLQTSPAFFSNELEYLYTGRGFGEAFEFIFDTSESYELVDSEEARIDKLRKDLVYMWRSRCCSDIHISITGIFSTSNPEHTTAVFSSHRFVLVSRSPYFRTLLLPWGSKAATAAGSSTPDEPLGVTLPSPPFTPASLHFTLGYIYTGTLVFSHRTYDLDTAFAILRSANYLSLPHLHTEIQARIVVEMLHGLYHAFLEFDEYERITNGKWGVGGCRCRQCARRVPRVLEFALADDVSNKHLERGARRALVGLFGEGWCNSEFAALPQKIRDAIVKGIGRRTTPANVFPLLFAAQHATKKLDAASDAWADISREMVSTAQKTIDECLVRESEACFEQAEWIGMLEGDGTGFEDGERVGWVMESLGRGMSERYAATVYQTLVSNVLLRPHPTETDTTMLSMTSHIRTQVEESRVDLLGWIRKRWMGVRQEGGFDALEGWSIKEISQEIEVPVEDLISPAPRHTLRNPHLSRALRPSLIRGGDTHSETLSVDSLRASVLSRAIAPSTATPSGPPKVRNHGTIRGGDIDSETLSVDSLRASVLSRAIAPSTATPSGPSKVRNHGTIRGGDIDSETLSVDSLRASVLSRAIAPSTATPSGPPKVRNHGTISRASERPDSKPTPNSASVSSVSSSATKNARAHVRHRKLPSTNAAFARPATSADDHESNDGDGEGDDDHDGASTPTPSITDSPNGRPTSSKITSTGTSSMRSTASTSASTLQSAPMKHPTSSACPRCATTLLTDHHSSDLGTNGLSNLPIPSSIQHPNPSLSSATFDAPTSTGIVSVQSGATEKTLVRGLHRDSPSPSATDSDTPPIHSLHARAPLISGRRFNDVQRHCEALLAAGPTTEAGESILRMVNEETSMTEPIKAWVSDFKDRCRSKLQDIGDNFADAQQFDDAISHYTIALSLDPASPRDLLVKRSKAFIEKDKWEDALNDSNEAIKVDPSSPLGYERKHAALLGMGHHDDAIYAFETMFSKMLESADPAIRERSNHYVRPQQTKKAICASIKNVIHNSPPVLIDTFSGRLCNKSERAAAFESTPSFTMLIASMTTDINHTLIDEVVGKFYRYATFSHTWEGDEPLYENVVKIVVYDLEALPTHEKLQMFCKIVRDEGFKWAWSDTCCIDKGDHFVLQEALVRMFKWYEGSAMTIIFLCDVDRLAEIGALTMSIWNSRGWTLQEYHASKVVRIYTKDWTPYLGLTIYNHKESPEIISEMEEATGISAQSLMALRPGLNDIREKLRLASTRQTTRVEDAAYSLLGIFSMTLPVTYGEGDQALGRLLSQLLMSTGDTCILAWTGISGSFNTCLPMNISVFSQPLTSYIPPAITDVQMGIITTQLLAVPLDLNLATRLYERLEELPTPLFGGQRMKLPCLAFKIKALSPFQSGSEIVFCAQADMLGTVEIQTRKNLMRLKDSLYLVHPWIDFLFDRRSAGNMVETTNEDRFSMLEELPSLDSFPELSSTSYASSLDVTSLASSSTMPVMDARLRVYQFLARLRRPFGALLLAPTRQNVYRRIAAESLITARVEEITTAMLDGLMQTVRVLDIL